MKLVILAALLLTGCSGHFGTVLYCPWGATCALQSVTPQPAEPEPPAKSASASV